MPRSTVPGAVPADPRAGSPPRWPPCRRRRGDAYLVSARIAFRGPFQIGLQEVGDLVAVRKSANGHGEAVVCPEERRLQVGLDQLETAEPLIRDLEGRLSWLAEQGQVAAIPARDPREHDEVVAAVRLLGPCDHCDSFAVSFRRGHGIPTVRFIALSTRGWAGRFARTTRAPRCPPGRASGAARAGRQPPPRS